MSDQQVPGMTCEELLKALNDYVDDETVLAVCREFAAHLAGCNPCQVVVDNIRQTIALYRAGEPFDLPEPVRGALDEQLRARWKARFGG